MNSKVKLLHVHTTQGYAGVLARESQFIFSYRTQSPACEMGLAMPLTAKSYAQNMLPGPLRQNLPEGYLRNWFVEHFGKTMKVDDFNLLAMTGHDMIGRVRCSIDEAGSGQGASGESLAELLAWRGTEKLFEHLANKYASTSGVAGVQPKVLVPLKQSGGSELIEKSSVKDRSLIVKAAGADYEGLAENEYHCMSIAALAGLDVPGFWLSDDRGLFIVERFDIDPHGRYLGFEDMTCLTGLNNDEKYTGSYEVIAKVIDSFVSPDNKRKSLTEYFKSVVLSMLVRNGDAHLKNFGLLYTDPTTEDARLSPLFDIVNTTMYIPKDVPALKLRKQKTWPIRQDLIEFGQVHCQVERPGEVIDQLAETVSRYRPNIEAGNVWAAMKKEFERGCASLAAPRFLAP